MDLARYQSPQLTTLALQVCYSYCFPWFCWLTIFFLSKLDFLDQVVNRFYTQINELFEKGTASRLLIVPESVSNFKRIMELIPVLRRLVLVKLEDENLEQMLRFDSFYSSPFKQAQAQ